MKSAHSERRLRVLWILLYPFLATLNLLLSLVSVVLVNWWAPLFATSDARLPRWLCWFDTFDADLDTGNRERGWNGGYWGRVRWLNRNHTYGFSYWRLGCDFHPSAWKVVQCHTGPRFKFVAYSTDGRFNLHVVRFGLRIKLGWKAWNMFDPASFAWKAQPWGPAWRIPFVCSVSRARIA